MCPPVILAGAAVISAGVSVAGTIMGANAAKSAADVEAKQAIQNAHYAEAAAKDALRQGSSGAAKARGQGTQLIGTQRVASATSGVDLESGSALETQAETREMTEQEALIIKADAARDAWGFRAQGLAYGQQAELSRKAGQQAKTGGFLTAIGQGIGGLGQAAGYFRKGGN